MVRLLFPQIPKEVRVGTKKKRGNLYLLHVPQFKAFALPNPDRTSNAEAHADMNKPPIFCEYSI